MVSGCKWRVSIPSCCPWQLAIHGELECLFIVSGYSLQASVDGEWLFIANGCTCSLRVTLRHDKWLSFAGCRLLRVELLSITSAFACRVAVRCEVLSRTVWLSTASGCLWQMLMNCECLFEVSGCPPLVATRCGRLSIESGFATRGPLLDKWQSVASCSHW